MRVTLEDVAREAGVHRTTVSMALRDHPRLPEKTRKRIQAISRRLGYVPNPLVSALMKQRVSRRASSLQGTLAYFNLYEVRAGRVSNAYTRMFRGAQAEASAAGFCIEKLDIRQPSMTTKGLQRLLRHRNIYAALVSPAPRDYRELDWVPWDKISAVALGVSLQHPDLHRVAHDYYHGMTLALSRAAALGYRRPLLLLSQEADSRVNHLWLASYLTARRLGQPSGLLPPLILDFPGYGKEQGSGLVMQKLGKLEPDLVIALPGMVSLPRLRETLISRKIPWLSLGCYNPRGATWGIYQNFEMIGRMAVRRLINQLYHSEWGVPEQSHDLLIRGTWVPPGPDPLEGLRQTEATPLKPDESTT